MTGHFGGYFTSVWHYTNDSVSNSKITHLGKNEGASLQISILYILPKWFPDLPFTCTVSCCHYYRKVQEINLSSLFFKLEY